MDVPELRAARQYLQSGRLERGGRTDRQVKENDAAGPLNLNSANKMPPPPSRPDLMITNLDPRRLHRHHRRRLMMVNEIIGLIKWSVMEGVRVGLRCE